VTTDQQQRNRELLDLAQRTTRTPRPTETLAEVSRWTSPAIPAPRPARHCDVRPDRPPRQRGHRRHRLP
ncbi:hypothetical protein ACWDBO_54135, partial [Streptomyces mirabilis]